MICQMEFIAYFLLFCLTNFILRVLFCIRSRPLNTGLRLVFLKGVASCSSVIKFMEKVGFFMIAKISLEEAYTQSFFFFIAAHFEQVINE